MVAGSGDFFVTHLSLTCHLFVTLLQVPFEITFHPTKVCQDIRYDKVEACDV